MPLTSIHCAVIILLKKVNATPHMSCRYAPPHALLPHHKIATHTHTHVIDDGTECEFNCRKMPSSQRTHSLLNFLQSHHRLENVVKTELSA